jgi:DNA-directed RNA polymerase specialized sigma24 family protein
VESLSAGPSPPARSGFCGVGVATMVEFGTVSGRRIVAASAHPTHPAEPPFERWAAARAPTVMRLAYLLTGSADRADIVVQDALVSACLRWRRFAASPQLESLVRQLVVRAFLRRHGPRPHGPRRRGDGDHRDGLHHHDEGVAAATGDVGVQPWAPLLGSADKPGPESTLIWQRCDTLSPRQRAALVLYCYDGLAAADIAATLGARTRTAAADVDTALAVVAPEAAGGRFRRAGCVEQVSRALQAHAEAAPPPYAPAERASARAGRQRRHRLAAATAAAALVLPLGWTLATDDETPTQPGRREALGSALSPAALGRWRWESWGGVQVQVPGDWGREAMSPWCSSAGPRGSAVDGPEPRTTHALCSLDGRRTDTGGLLLRRDDDGPPLSRGDLAPYASARIRTVGGITLTVVNIDPAVASAILASAEVVGARDVNGCRPRRDSVRPAQSPSGSPGEAIPPTGPVVAVSVCRYGLNGWPRPTLLSSRLFSGRPADRVVTALRAVREEPPSSAPTGCRLPARELAVLELWTGHGTGGPRSVVVSYRGCRGHGIDDGALLRGLTAPVRTPILVPP